MASMCLRSVLLGGAAALYKAAPVLAVVPAHARQQVDLGVAEVPGDHGTALFQVSTLRSALHREPVSTRDDPHKTYTLLISSKGMTSHLGAGVRQMAMMMDLKSCGVGVDTLTERMKDEADWSSAVALDILAYSTNFHVWRDGSRSNFNATKTLGLMRRYDRILFFGWAWETELASTAEVALQALEMEPSLHRKVTLVLDDNPSNRCYVGHDLSFCRQRAPALISRWLNVSDNAMAISQQDALALNKLSEKHRLPGPKFEVWPMRLMHLQHLFERNYREDEGQNWTRPYLTMVANDHAENRRFVSELVEGGHLESICNASRTVPWGIRRLKVYFIGTIAHYMQHNFRKQMEDLRVRCVRLKYVISDQQLHDDILPQTMAILNPFLDTVRSGVSVKTFQAVATNSPIVTSLAGFRGLEECGKRLDHAGLLAPNTAAGHVRFIVDNLVFPDQSIKFTKAQQSILRECRVAQEAYQCS